MYITFLCYDYMYSHIYKQFYFATTLGELKKSIYVILFAYGL